MTHISKYAAKPQTLKYWRKPTEYEIKIGYGATHYRDFEFDFCFDEKGNERVSFVLREDGMRYNSCNADYYRSGAAKKLNYELWLEEKTSKKKR